MPFIGVMHPPTILLFPLISQWRNFPTEKRISLDLKTTGQYAISHSDTRRVALRGIQVTEFSITLTRCNISAANMTTALVDKICTTIVLVYGYKKCTVQYIYILFVYCIPVYATIFILYFNDNCIRTTVVQYDSKSFYSHIV